MCRTAFALFGRESLRFAVPDAPVADAQRALPTLASDIPFGAHLSARHPDFSSLSQMYAFSRKRNYMFEHNDDLFRKLFVTTIISFLNTFITF